MGNGMPMVNGVRQPLGQLPPDRNNFNGAASRISDADHSCVMCQYFVQRIKGFVIENSNPLAYVEEDAKISKSKHSLPANVASSSTTPAAQAKQQPGWVAPHFTDNLAAEKRREKEHEDTQAESASHLEQQQAKPGPDGYIDAELVRSVERSKWAAATIESRSEVKNKWRNHHKSASQASNADNNNNNANAEHLSSTHAQNAQQQQQNTEQKPNFAGLELSAHVSHRVHNARNSDSTPDATSPIQTQPVDAPVMLETSSQAKAEDSLLPRRFRDTDMREYRPNDMRYDITSPMAPNAYTQQRRYEFEVMSAMVYQSFVSLCKARMPEPYFGMCGKMVSQYRTISEGLHYGDRPDEVCVRMQMCNPESYVVNSAHALYRSDISSGNRKTYFDEGV
jgi:hypothetical protein